MYFYIKMIILHSDYEDLTRKLFEKSYRLLLKMSKMRCLFKTKTFA